MPDSLTSTTAIPPEVPPQGRLPGNPPPVAAQSGVTVEGGPGTRAGGSDKPLAATANPLTAGDHATTDGSADRGIPAVAPRMAALQGPPAPGTVLRYADNPGLGDVINRMFRRVDGDPADPPGSDWTNRNDIRLVLPVYAASSGAVSSSLQTLPGRNQSWVTVNAGQKPADDRFNFDGVQGGVRLGLAGPLLATWSVTGDSMRADQLQQLQWAEFRVGAEGLVFSGRMVDGKFNLTSFDLEQGFFKSKVDDLGDWAGKNLAIAIPVGIVAAGAVVGASHLLADKTGKDFALPLGMAVYDKNGIYVRPSVRPIFGKDQFLKFGGADLNLGYSQPGKFSINVVPGYNNDPNLGPKGFSAGAMATVALPFNGTAGAEVRYNPQGGVSAYAGVSFTF